MNLPKQIENWKEIFNNIISSVSYISTDYKILWVNKPGLKAIKKELGYSPEKVIGKYCFKILKNNDGICDNCLLQKAIKTEKSITEKMQFLKNTYHDGAFPIKNEGGKLIGIIKINLDIKEIREIQKKLEKEKTKLDYFASLSHEFRTPLTLMHSVLHILESKLEDKDKKYLDILKQNNYRLFKLTNNLLDIHKIERKEITLNFKNDNIVDFLKYTTLSTSEYFEQKDIKLEFYANTEKIITAFDPFKMERVILNLLANAHKHTEAKGKVSVSVKQKNKTVVIAVKDNGKGIPEKKQKHIFNEFMQVENSTNRSHEGTGLGLSIVKSLVELHGGNIKVKSILGEETEFIISLPLKKIKENSDEETNYHPDRIINTHEIEFSDVII